MDWMKRDALVIEGFTAPDEHFHLNADIFSLANRISGPGKIRD